MKPRRTTTETPIAQYTIVSSQDVTNFEKKVQAMLAQGWKLQGSVCYCQWFFYQAMVK